MDNTEVKPNPHAAWVAELDAAEKELKKFKERGRKTVRRYLDERDTITAGSKWFNIFHANTNILQAALYAQPPKPIVSRRFKDFDDDVGRVAANIIQRCITQDIDDPEDTFDVTVRNCIMDRLVPGLGQAWLRLETETRPAVESIPAQPETGEYAEDTEEETEPLQEIYKQKVCVDYVYWEDFLYSPCRVWEERRWVARVVYMDRDELVKAFGEDKGKAVPLDYTPNPLRVGSGGESTPEDNTVKKAKIYEIWSRKDRKVIWISRGMSQIVQERDDFLKLKGFEPCPKPMLANVSTSNATPRPDFYMIQDQYDELDVLNNRISLLTKACKVVGVYDKGAIGVARMLKEGFDNDLIPVDNWAMFAEKGGIKGQTDWLPLEQIVNALVQLGQQREVVKQQIYELTGIADIVRGASKASETLGAQEIKAKFASVRIKRLQDEVARFVSDILRIKAEIMCEHFEPEVLVRISNIMETPDAKPEAPPQPDPMNPQAMPPESTTGPQLIDAAIALLKDNEYGFEWRIQVSADSIAQADYDMEKADRIEFLTAVSSYLERAGAMFMQVPQSAQLLIGMLKWAMAGFKNTQEIEGMIDQALDQLTKSPPQEKPDPEQQKMELEKFKIESKVEQDQQKMAMDQQMAQQKLQMEQQMNEQKLEFEREMFELKLWFEQQMQQMKLQGEQVKQQQQIAQGQQQMEMQERQSELQLEQQERQGEQQLQQADQSHQQTLEQSSQASKVKIDNAKAEQAVKPKGKGNGNS